jgi:hypothetical protein
MLQHALADCPHNPTFEHMIKTLDRLDSHTERTAVAMEEMAKQGAILANHEHRLNTYESDLREAFGRLRTVEQTQAKDQGADEVIGEQRKFWAQVKVALTPKILSLAIFAIYLVDRLNVGAKLAKLWKEMNG